MKKTMLAIAAAGLLLSCEKGGERIDTASLDNLAKISVADAQLIYKRSENLTRSGSDKESGYWKIDNKGNESRIVISDEQGKEVEVEINEIKKLNDDLLYISTRYGQLLADTKTEKLYKAPDSFVPNVQKDGSGKLYYLGFDAMVYQLDMETLTVKTYLAEKQSAHKFLINKNGTCWYDGRIQCTGGRIYQGSENCFVDNGGTLYAIRNNGDIACITKINDGNDPNTIEEEEICYAPVAELGGVYQWFANPKNGNVMLLCGEGLCEFDGSATTIRFVSEWNSTPWEELMETGKYEDCNWGIPPRLDRMSSDHYSQLAMRLQNFNPYDPFQGALRVLFTNNHLFAFEDTRGISEIYKMGLTDNVVDNIAPYGYDLYSLAALPTSGNLTFSGLRFDDGKVVIGEITPDGEVTVTKAQESGAQIINLIALN